LKSLREFGYRLLVPLLGARARKGCGECLEKRQSLGDELK